MPLPNLKPKTPLSTMNQKININDLTLKNGELILSNAAPVGTHAGTKTEVAGVTLLERDLLVSYNATGNILPAGADTDAPIGVATDSAQAGDAVSVSLLGASANTLKVIAAAPVGAGDFLVAAASGRTAPLPTEPGRYFVIGRALTSAMEGQRIEMDPSFPTERIVS